MSHINCGETPVVGIQYSLRDRGLKVEDLKALRVGDQLELTREPKNEYDFNAIAVTRDGKHFGYIPATLAKHLAPMIDHGIDLFARVNKLSLGATPSKHELKVELVWNAYNVEFEEDESSEDDYESPDLDLVRREE